MAHRFILLTGLAVVGHASPTARAQDTTITFSIKWEKATIGQGETNTGGVWAEITPGIGSVIKWTTPPGKGQEGKILAFASSVFDTMNLLNGTKGTLQWTVPQAWNIASLPGVHDGQGGIAGSNAGQTGGGGLNPSPVLDNPVQILSLKWTEQTGGSYDVNYGVKSLAGGMYLGIGLIPMWVPHKATFRVDGQDGFSVIPTPGAVTVVAFGLAAAMRRRRR